MTPMEEAQQAYDKAVEAHEQARKARRAVTMNKDSTRDQCAAATFAWAKACDDFDAAYDKAIDAGVALIDSAVRDANPHRRP